MQTRTLLTLCSMLLAAAPAAPAWAQGSWTKEQRAIAGLIAKTEAANNAGDVDAWVRLFTEDAVYMPPGSPAVTTREGLVEVARAGFRNQASIHIEPIEIRITEEWAFARSRVTGHVTLARSEKRVTVDVKQLAIYRRGDDGVWRIARLINNSNTS